MMNMPEVKLGIVAVSRDCFPITLSESRRKAVAAAYKGELYECPTVVESELDMQKALKEVQEAGCNALVVYLGNFGPETAETLLVKYLFRCLLTLSTLLHFILYPVSTAKIRLTFTNRRYVPFF